MFQAKGLSIQVAFLYDLISGNWAWPARKPQRSMALVLMQTMPTSHPVLSGHPPSEEACKWMWLCPQIGQRKHNSLSWVQKMCITTVYTIISNIHVPTNESIPAQCSVLIYIYIYTTIYTYIYGADVCPKCTGIQCGPAICCVVSMWFFSTLQACKILISFASRGILALITSYHLLKRILKIFSVICSVSSRELRPQQTARLWIKTKKTNPK